MAYLIDSNVFIEACNRYYGLDFCPAFWDWLLQSNSTGSVFSLDKVRQELKQKEGDLSLWSNNIQEGFFLRPDNLMFQALTRVSVWAQSQKFEQSAIHAFLDDADCYLVSCSLAHKYTLVTHENTKAFKHKIKLPDVCKGLGVDCINTFEMLRREKARFVLGVQPQQISFIK